MGGHGQLKVKRNLTIFMFYLANHHRSDETLSWGRHGNVGDKRLWPVWGTNKHDCQRLEFFFCHTKGDNRVKNSFISPEWSMILSELYLFLAELFSSRLNPNVSGANNLMRTYEVWRTTKTVSTGNLREGSILRTTDGHLSTCGTRLTGRHDQKPVEGEITYTTYTHCAPNSVTSVSQLLPLNVSYLLLPFS